MREKTNFRGGNLGHGDSALSKAGAVTSGDYSRPQLKHYHKCAPGLGSSQASGHPVMKSKGLRRGQLSSPFSLLLRENGIFDG